MADRAGRSGRSGEGGDRGVYVISVAAELAGVHPQTLRIYERKGLLSPARTAGNTRRYSQSDIARLQLIQQLTQEAGVNLAGVKMIVELQSELERLRTRLQSLDRDLQRARQRMQQELARAQHPERGEIVPVSQVRRLRWMLRARPTAAGEPSRRGPIPAGPAGG
jgi:MerR family transcriptional regulator/heat shock protein HspR